MQIEGFFDCSCVWAYLAFEHATQAAVESGTKIRWRPVLAQDLFDTVNPAAYWPLSSVKRAYYENDVRNWADYLGLPLASDPLRPVRSAEVCMLACVAAQRWDRLDRFVGAALRAAWGDGLELDDQTVLAQLWAEAGLPAELLQPSLAWPEVAAELRANGQDLIKRGGFGTPTFLIGEDIFFGNDAIPLLERSIRIRSRLAAVGS